MRGGFPNGEDFGVRGWIVKGDRGVPAAAHDFSAHNDDGADGRFLACCALARQAKRFLHEPFVGLHESMISGSDQYG